MSDEKKKGPPDPEILANLNLLMDMELIEEEKNWGSISYTEYSEMESESESDNTPEGSIE